MIREMLEKSLFFFLEKAKEFKEFIEFKKNDIRHANTTNNKQKWYKINFEAI